MSFDSLGYFLFLYAVFCLYWLWRPSASLLLAASIAFTVSFDWRNILRLILLSAITYMGGRAVEKTRATWVLFLLLAVIFLPLLFFKLGFASLTFPLGLSFLTFHCASYLIDVSRGVVRAEPKPSRLFLYLSFFPQLVAGPITRAAEILPQFLSPSRPDGSALRRSLWRIYLGLVKKLAIANVLGLYSRAVFHNPEPFHLVVLLSAVMAGRYFVYADFSGYTDIAIGSAGLLGIRLPENFLRPFAASSINDYWRRWHVTLSSWIRDYLFFPLASTRAAVFGAYPILLVTFVVLGLWHGFSENFVLYGLWHGAFVILSDLTMASRKSLWRALGVEKGILSQWLFPWATFLFLICPPTILFLTPNLSAAGNFLASLMHPSMTLEVEGVPWFRLLSALLTISFLEIYQWIADRYDTFSWLEGRGLGTRWLVVIGAGLWLAISAYGGENMGFLYFGF